jgi:hypothetical protein
MADEGGRMKDESRRLSGQKPLHLSAFSLYSSIRGEETILHRGESFGGREPRRYGGVAKW